MKWTILVPVKGGADAKSRLPEHLGGVPRADLARAFACDTITAALAADAVVRVIVIAGGPDVARALSPFGATIEVVHQVAGAGLNEAIAHAAGSLAGPVAVLLGDVPAATSHDLDAALADAAAFGRAVVADADGAGTTLLADATGALTPQFGQGSFARHTACGYTPLEVALALRADVDTEVDLDRAVTLGVGRHTASALGLVPEEEARAS